MYFPDSYQAKRSPSIRGPFFYYPEVCAGMNKKTGPLREDRFNQNPFTPYQYIISEFL
jgi:hypothetical protein